MIALGPVIGLVLAPEFGDLTVLVALGALLLAVVGVVIERSDHTDRLAAAAAAVAALVAVLAGARLGPTGIEAFDVAGAFLFVFVVMKSIDGLGNADGLAAGVRAGRRHHPVRDRRLRASGRAGLRARGLRRRVLRVPGVQRAPGVPLRRPRRSARHRVHPRGRRAGGRSRPGVVARADHAAHPPRHLRPRRPHGRGIPTAAAAVIAPAPQRPRRSIGSSPSAGRPAKRSSSWWWPRSSCP